eukprot:scaffold66255_cov78-Phaeocystis_antarctica.AAC.2
MPIRCGEGKFHDSSLTCREVRDSLHLNGILRLVSGGVEIGYPFASHHGLDASRRLVISGRGRCTSVAAQGPGHQPGTQVPSWISRDALCWTSEPLST